MSASSLTTLDGLPPRTRQILVAAIRRPDLPLTDIALEVGISVGNLRRRLRDAYKWLGVSGRVELVARFAPLLTERPGVA